MKKNLLWAALALPALLAFTACSSDDDDNNGGGTGGPALNAPTTAMTTAPTQAGWSGNRENGVLYYSPREAEALAMKSKIMKRAVDDDDDDDEDYNAKLFMSFNMQEGKVRAGLAGSVICMEFEDANTARTIYNNLKNYGDVYDDEDDEDDYYGSAWENAMDSLWTVAVKENVHLQGRTVWFPQNTLGGLRYSQLETCIALWLDNEDIDYDKTYFPAPLFATNWNEDSLSYECVSQPDKLTEFNLWGVEKWELKGVRTDTVVTGYKQTIYFSSANMANLWFQNTVRDPQPGVTSVTVEGKILTVEYMVNEGYTADMLKKLIIYNDVMNYVPLFFYVVFDSF